MAIPAFVRHRVLPFAAALVALTPCGADAQQQQERPKNLKVLPRDLPRDSVIQIMRGISLSLGVRCVYCHVDQDPGPEDRFDFALDDKPEKEKARFMMRMTRELNTEILPRLPNREDPPVGVACVTCHRGLPVPTTLDRVLQAALDSGGAPAAVARYRQLRQEEALRGRWDFGETTVNELARRLGATGKTAEAIALLEMNAEFFPSSAAIDLALGDLHRARGERDQAIVRYRTALQKQPGNQQAQRRLNELTGTPAPAPPRR
jgi:hypothetical protein